MSTQTKGLSDRGVSTVIGVVVLLAVVVLLSAVVGVFTFGVVDTQQDSAFAGVTVSQTADTTVEVRVNSMGEASALLVRTAGGQQVITEPGVYEYESYGQQVNVIGSDGENTQLLTTFTPDTNAQEVSNVLVVTADNTVQSADGNQTFETLQEAKQAAEPGDIIRFQSGEHVQPETVNQTVTTPVTVVAEPNTVFSCEKTKVNLRLENATMSKRSAFIQTNQCGFQPVTVPAPENSGGSVEVLAGGSDATQSNPNTASGDRSASNTLFESGGTTNGDSTTATPTATSDTTVTLRVSDTSSYESLTVQTQAGSQTFTEPGVYSVETYGYNATVSATTERGKTMQIDQIVVEEQQPSLTTDTTRNGETVTTDQKQPVDTYLVTADQTQTVAPSSPDSVKQVDTLTKADKLASKGNLIKLESGVHTHPDTVTASLSTNVTLALEDGVKLSCKEIKIDLSLGEATLSDQSPFPDVFCNEYNGVTEKSVTKTINSSGVSIPENVSFERAITESAGERITDVVTDSAGNVYVTGYSNTGDWNYYTVKYDSQGNELWSKQYNNGGNDAAFGITVGSAGNVYVTGLSQSGGDWDYYTVKYDSQGNELWSKRYDNGNDDVAFGIAVGSAGNVYVTGKSQSGGDDDYHTIKYDSQGNELWSKRYSNSNDDEARGITVDSAGNVYVTGRSKNGGDWDYHTIKYDSQGNKIWSKRYDNGNGDNANGITVDSAGNVYVTGYSSQSSGDNDYYTIKYDSQGNEIWSKRYDTGNDDRAHGITVDSAGNVYVTGLSQSGGDYDYYTIKYDLDGNELWNKRYDRGSQDYAYGITVTDEGTVYVGGQSSDEYHLRKYTGE